MCKKNWIEDKYSQQIKQIDSYSLLGKISTAKLEQLPPTKGERHRKCEL